ncbi:CD209 antigen, partial [Silurus meridionalis]
LSARRLGFLCVLLLTVIIILCIKHSIDTHQMWRDHENMTVQRDQLLTRYNIVTIDKNILQSSYDTINMEKNRLLDLNNNLTLVRDALQKKLSKMSFCLYPWKSFSSSCYLLFSKKQSWEQSRKECKNVGADLVIINSREEQQFVSDFKMKMWIGLTDQDQEGQWKWVDNTPLEFGYWRNSEPNDSGNEDCAELVSNNNNTPDLLNWNDVQCTHDLYGLCEKKM